MTRAEISRKVIDIVTRVSETSVPVSALDEQTTLAEDLGLGVSRRTDLVVALEDEFQLPVSENADTTWQTIGDVINAVDGVLNPAI